MNKNWPQQEIFCTRVRDFAVGRGLVTPRGSLKLEPLAELFKMSAGTLKQDLQNKNRERPGVEKLVSIAEIIGCDRNEFWKTAAPLGIEKENWAKASERDRVLSNAMLEDLMSIPEDEKEAYWELYKQGVFKGLARMKAEQEAKGGKGEKP